MSETLVTAVIPAYNHPVFLREAVASVLAQTYPNVEAVIVDDGSTDETGAVADELAAAAPDRVRVVHKPNGGYNSAFNAGLAEARGAYIALLDADDAWLPHKLERQVAVLDAHPEVALVHSSQRLVDAHGATLHRSWFEYSASDPAHGRPFAELLLGNTVGASSIVLRRSALAAYLPIPAAFTYGDWYLAVAAARTGEIWCLPEPLSLYRFHGSNMTLSEDPRILLGEARKRLRFQRLAAALADPGTLTAAEAHAVVVHLDSTAGEIVQAAGTLFTDVTTVSEDERAASARLLADRPLQAVALDPWSTAAREAFAAWLPTAPSVGISYRRPRLPDPAICAARGPLLAAAGTDLLDDPALLLEYAQGFAPSDDVTLVATAAAPDEAAALERVATDAGLAAPDAPDMLVTVVPDERRYELGWCSAGVVGGSLPAPDRRPRAGRGSVARLRALVV